jgi:Ca2+-binding EF-hand superfamily protein
MSRKPTTVKSSSNTTKVSKNNKTSDDDYDGDGTTTSNSTGAPRAPTMDEVCENVMHISSKPSERTVAKYETKIKEVFKYFNKQTKEEQLQQQQKDEKEKKHIRMYGFCDVRDVGTIVRALNLNPSEATVLKIIEDCEEEESTGFIQFAKLFPVLMKCCLMREYNNQILEREDEQMLRRAFAALDRNGTGWIDAEIFKKLLMATKGGNSRPTSAADGGAVSISGDGNISSGEPFSAEEMERTLEAIVDPATGKINIDDYISLLMES